MFDQWSHSCLLSDLSSSTQLKRQPALYSKNVVAVHGGIFCTLNKKLPENSDKSNQPNQQTGTASNDFSGF